ncbi:DUF1360 domain-containing protein [Streptomyces sp. NPDC051207]|uniref:DUF1360 domain-containing protein n=1 Tax=Streptomyces sp. NPDC051207 TaxID=3154641 RepID=UPI003430DC99
MPEQRNDDQYDNEAEVPVKGYAALAGTFAAGATLFTVTAWRRGLRLPDQVPPWDVALLGTATFKASRLLSRDKVTSFLRAPFTRRAEDGAAGEVTDESRGGEARRAVGDLVTCPFCTSVWVAAALTGTYACAPRAARMLAAGLTAVTMADWLQYAWTRTQASVE